MIRWALRMPRDSASALGPLRLAAGIEAAILGSDLWLRGETPGTLGNDDQRQLRELPGAERFSVGDDAALIPLGGRVPTGWLPQTHWLPLREFLRPLLPTTRLPASAVNKHSLALVGDRSERPSAALLTSIAIWAAYADSAPLVRLARLSFLASGDQRVFIVGTPLPPLAGQRYWESSGVFVAAGYSWRPVVDVLLVRRALGLADEELAIWHADGSWERADRENLVAARRGAVRATMEGLDRANR